MINDQGKKSMLLVREWIRAELRLTIQSERFAIERVPHRSVIVESRMKADDLFNEILDLLEEKDE